MAEMKYKKEFIKAITGLLYYWGSDTPPEVIWGLNELMDWYEMEYEKKVKRFEEFDSDEKETTDGEVLNSIDDEYDSEYGYKEEE